MYQDNPNKKDHLSDPNTTCISMKTEMKERFRDPIQKKPAVTRAKLLEKFLWHQFYDEYIRSKGREEALRSGNPTTEYFNEFRGSDKRPDSVATVELVNKYPLYSTRAITVWNPKGEFTCTFKRVATITKSTSLQSGKFDDDDRPTI